ncbi:MAG: nitrous oxide reductase accessory protein NosL, partial [Candidatus Rokubacteria bacterium]|nr:nitrous oxide reductase accessory protein NosL [Candidatus Rokubacteria bacterium]
MRRLALALLAVGLAGCEAGPAPIAYGRAACAWCRMTISDPRFGAELVARRGKIYTFDSIECLAGFVASGQVAPGDVHSLWVTDFARPPKLVAAKDAVYLRAGPPRSPMGMGLAAFAERADLAHARAGSAGDELTWDRVVAGVRDSGFVERPPAAGAP